MFKKVFTDYTVNGDHRIDIHLNNEYNPPQLEITIEYSPNDRPTLTLEMQEVRNLAYVMAAMVDEVEGK